MTWKVPICEKCWTAEQPPRKAWMAWGNRPERCVICGETAHFGMYIECAPVKS